MHIESIFPVRKKKGKVDINMAIRSFATNLIIGIERAISRMPKTEGDLEQKLNFIVENAINKLRKIEGISPYGLSSLYDAAARLIPELRSRYGEYLLSASRYSKVAFKGFLTYASSALVLWYVANNYTSLPELVKILGPLLLALPIAYVYLNSQKVDAMEFRNVKTNYSDFKKNIIQELQKVYHKSTPN